MPIRQDQISLKGHAIEARIYAENPYKGFNPSPGKIHRIKHPFGSGIRIESAVEDGSEITPHYDPMISKLIVYGPTRDAATRKLSNTLENYLISGVHTTAAYIRDLIKHPDFRNNNYHTKYLDDYDQPIPAEFNLVARALAASQMQTGSTRAMSNNHGNGISHWRTSSWPQGGWRQ